MGTAVAANYANLFMDMFKTSLLNDFHTHTHTHTHTPKKNLERNPLIWLRSIDDIFFIWAEDKDSLKEFLAFYQKYNETRNMKLVIKLEISQSTKTINFLDVYMTLNKQTSYTTFFSKHTDAHIYLNPKSCHPEHKKKRYKTWHPALKHLSKIKISSPC